MQERISVIKETLNKLIQLGVRPVFIPLKVHHERNQLTTVRLYAPEGTESVEALNQRFFKSDIASYA